VRLFGALHLTLIAGTVAVTIAFSKLIAARRIPITPLRITFGVFLAAGEFVWWVFRYSHEGIHAANLPLQLCDLTLWLSVAACLTLRPAIVEFTYFAGIAGAGAAILTPDLWSPWPSYAAIYFFVAHGGIVIAMSMLVFGRVVPLRKGAVWRAFGWLLIYAAALGIFNAFTGANYMYLSRKPASASALDLLGPWPFYIFAGVALALVFFWLLWLPAPKQTE
jgi:hypothetical integral membrane protein (TIGR02206 family)